MNKIGKTIVTGMAALMAAAPIITTTTVKAADNNNVPITQGAGYDELTNEQSRLLDMRWDSKYNSAQELTLQQKETEYYQGQVGKSDEQQAAMAKQLKAYLDGPIPYTVDSTYIGGLPVNEERTGVIGADELLYTFDRTNEPKMEKIVFKGYTLLDKQGNVNTTGEVSMWLDDDYNIRIDPNYATTKNNMELVHLAQNGAPYTAPKQNTTWTNNKSVVSTSHMSYLYTFAGKVVQNRALAANTAWYTDRYATINGEKMYRVATNEWVSADDVD